jgi:hypothetical protein
MWLQEAFALLGIDGQTHRRTGDKRSGSKPLHMTFGQDAHRTRTGNAADNFAVVRYFALNIIHNYKGDRLLVPGRRRTCDFHHDCQERLLRAATQG